MNTFASLFTGGGGADVGAKAAGSTTIFGVESVRAIADVAHANGFHVHVADVRAVDWATLPVPTWLHASPPCINASVAKSNAGETPLDGELADAVCRAIATLLPPRVTIENVWQYRTFNAFLSILACLSANGYSYEYWHLNSASYGVPQTRKRLILVAKRGLWRIQRPEPTHTKGGDMWLPAWIGWYEAIADLLDTLPESHFADWQKKRLPEYLTTSTTSMIPRVHSFLMRSQNAQQAGGNQMRHADDPAMCITARERSRAFVMDCQNTDHTHSDRRRDDDEPIFTVTAIDRPSHMPRAWLSQGRVVSMTPRALARFMSVPDTYILPEKNSLACRVLGNMVCPPVMQAIGESL